MAFTARVKRNERSLALLRRAKASVRKQHIKKAPKDMILALVDIAKAMIKGQVSLSPQQLGVVRRNERNFKSLVAPGKTLTAQKKILQKGGFLGALLGPLLKIGAPIIGGLLGLGK